MPCGVDIGIGNQTAHFKSPFFDLSMQINYQLKNLTNTNNANNYLDKIASLINNYVNVKHFEQSDLDKLDMSNWLKLKENYLDKYSSFKFYSDLENHNSRYYDEEDIERITDELTFLSEFARAIGLFDGETTYDIEDSNGNLHKIKASALAYRFLDKFFRHFALGNVIPRLSIANRGSINKDFLIFINKNADRILEVAETEREILSGIEEMFAVDVEEDTSDMVLDCENNYSHEESEDTERE